MASQTISGGRGNRGILADVLAWRAAGKSEASVKSLLVTKGYKKGRISQLLQTFRAGVNQKNSLKTADRKQATAVKKDVALKADRVAHARRGEQVKTKHVLRRPSSSLLVAAVDEHPQQSDELPPCVSRPEELGSEPAAVWEWLNTMLDKVGDPRGDFARELKSFSQFTSFFKKEIDQAGHPIIDMPCGPCGGSERCLAQYLLHVR